MKTNQSHNGDFIQALQKVEDFKEQALGCKCDESAKILASVSKFGCLALSEAHSGDPHDADEVLVETIGLLLQNEPASVVTAVLSRLVIGLVLAKDNSIHRPILVQ